MQREIDRQFEKDRAEMRRFQLLAIGLIVVFWALIAAAAWWCVVHPEAIGDFFGRIVKGTGN